MSQLRFPNPGSNIDRLVQSFSLIAKGTQGRDSFGLDDMTAILTEYSQASSQGAHGQMAVDRSRRKDRSRDPLYNQLKMYSEIYRMLGWIRPLVEHRLKFRTTLLGETVAFDTAGDPEYLRGLVQESLLAVVFPNEVIQNIGVASQRPFCWLLKLANALDGVITRHEIVIGLLAVVDDRQPQQFENVVERIRDLRRGRLSGLIVAANEFAATQNVQPNTLMNYTRLPVGVLTSELVNWGERVRVRSLYADSRPVPAITLRPSGKSTAASVDARRDIRIADVAKLSLDERTAFAEFSFYATLERAGLPGQDIEATLTESAKSATTALQKLDISWPEMDFLFNPFTQEDETVLTLAQSGES
jgi:hypothetical protein